MELVARTMMDGVVLGAVFRRSPFSALITFCVVATLQTAVVVAYVYRQVAFVFVFIVSIFSFVFLYRCLFELYTRCTRLSWLIGLSDADIYINYRSYLYGNTDKQAKQIVRIGLCEIEAFQETHITDVLYQGRTKSRHTATYLDLITWADVAPLEKALASEHLRHGLGQARRSWIEVSWMDFPVSVPQPKVIRIDVGGITPRKSQLFAELSRLGLRAQDACQKTYDFTQMTSRDHCALQRIVELLKAGRRLEARQAIEQVFRVAKTEANKMIDALVHEHVVQPGLLV